MIDVTEPVEIDDIIENLKNVDYSTLGEKVRTEFDEYYNLFKSQFVNDEGILPDEETQKDMIGTTYAMSLQLLTNAIGQLEYSYKLILAIEKIIKDSNLDYDDLAKISMTLSRKYIEQSVNNITTDLNDELVNILLKLKELKDE